MESGALNDVGPSADNMSLSDQVAEGASVSEQYLDEHPDDVQALNDLSNSFVESLESTETGVGTTDALNEADITAATRSEQYLHEHPDDVQALKDESNNFVKSLEDTGSPTTITNDGTDSTLDSSEAGLHPTVDRRTLTRAERAALDQVPPDLQPDLDQATGGEISNRASATYDYHQFRANSDDLISDTQDSTPLSGGLGQMSKMLSRVGDLAEQGGTVWQQLNPHHAHYAEGVKQVGKAAQLAGDSVERLNDYLGERFDQKRQEAVDHEGLERLKRFFNDVGPSADNMSLSDQVAEGASVSEQYLDEHPDDVQALNDLSNSFVESLESTETGVGTTDALNEADITAATRSEQYLHEHPDDVQALKDESNNFIAQTGNANALTMIESSPINSEPDITNDDAQEHYLSKHNDELQVPQGQADDFIVLHDYPQEAFSTKVDGGELGSTNEADAINNQSEYSDWVTPEQGALFSPQELQRIEALRTPDGSNNYRSGEILADGQRTEAIALITPEAIELDAGTAANPRIRVPGFESGYGVGDKGNHARGHLIAACLGGSGNDPANLVCLDQMHTNRYMEQRELDIQEAAKNGESIYYSVTPVYDVEGSERKAPIGVTMRAVGDQGFYMHETVTNLNQPRPSKR